MATSAGPPANAPELLSIFTSLYAAYGRQHWWPSESAFETVVGAILTQSTAWSNVEHAIARLRAAGALSPAAINALDPDTLAEIIRPSGYFRAKARKLQAFCLRLERDFAGCLETLLALPAEPLRAYLLAIYGIGPETADAIVLYAAGQPTFVVDAYTLRVFSRLGLAPEARDYETWRQFFLERLPSDPQLFNEYHALIVQHAKAFCKKRPVCSRCMLRARCPIGAQSEDVALSQPIAVGLSRRHAIP